MTAWLFEKKRKRMAILRKEERGLKSKCGDVLSQLVLASKLA
jgi:hypothetical protein